jgi:hypothetical protein
MDIISKHTIKKLDKTQWSLSILLIASPWILLFITTSVIAHQPVFNSIPCWSDELGYWHEILSCTQKGIGFGYYSMNEAVPANLSFGTHGFGAVSVYALFGSIFGWKAYSIVIANCFFVSLAFLFLTLFLNISTKKLLFILLFYLTFTPVILFTSTSMTEILNVSVLIIYISLLHFYFKKGGFKWLVVLMILCTAISFIRIIYIILILPLLFKRKNEFKFDLKFLLYFVLWIVFGSLLFVLNNLFVSPYPDSFLNDLLNSNNFTGFITDFGTHFVENTLNLINPVSENSVQVLQRYFLISVIIICFIKSNIVQSKFKKLDREFFIVFLILFLFVMINIGAYDVFDWRDYRVLAPILFGCIVYLILNDKTGIIYPSFVFNLVGILFLFLSPQIVESFNTCRYTKPLHIPILRSIEYTAHPVSRFENTIVVQQFNPDIVLNIPAGIGISYSDELTDKLKSRYIYSDKELKLRTYKIVDSDKSGKLYQKILEPRQ